MGIGAGAAIISGGIMPPFAILNMRRLSTYFMTKSLIKTSHQVVSQRLPHPASQPLRLLLVGI
jgi:hypothetical protein